MSYSKTTQELVKLITSMLDEYQHVDEKSPFSKKIFTDLSKKLDDFEKLIIEINDSLDNEMASLVNKKNEYKLEFDKTIDELNLEYITTLNAIKDNYINKNRELNEEIKNINSQYQENVALYTGDVDFYILSAEQNVELFEFDFKQDMQRYDYLYANAKESYKANISKYNEELKRLLDKAHYEYTSTINKYDEDANKLINIYTTSIENYKAELEIITKKHNEILDEYRNERRIETLELNNSIRNIDAARTANIDTYKQTYQGQQAKADSERDQAKIKIRDENRASTKEYAISLSKLEEANSIENKQYGFNCDKLVEKQSEESFECHKKEETEYVDAYKELNDAEFKKESKLIKKKYYQEKNNILKKYNSILHDLEVKHNKHKLDNEHKKNILDIANAKNIKFHNEKDTRINKIHQELLNEYESEYNINVQNENNLYKIKANEIRMKSSFKTNVLDNKIEKENVEYNMKVSEIESQIKMAEMEIDTLKTINEFVHICEDKKYNRKKNYLTVSSMLEMEKCRVLDELNIKQRSTNIKNSQLVLYYNMSKIEIQNEKFKEVTKQEILLEEAKLNTTQFELNKKLDENKILEKYEYLDEKLKANFKVDTITNTILRNSHLVDIEQLTCIISKFLDVLSSTIEFSISYLDYIYSNSTKAEDFALIKTFTIRFYDLLFTYYSNVTLDFKDYSLSILNERVKFESDYKYSVLLNQYQIKYEETLNELYSEKNEINSNIASIDADINSNVAKVNKINSSISNAEERKYNKGMLSTLNKSISMMKKEKAVLLDRNNEIDVELVILEKENARKIEHLEAQKIKSISSYNEFKNRIEDTCDTLMDVFVTSSEKLGEFDDRNAAIEAIKAIQETIVDIKEKYLSSIQRSFDAFRKQALDYIDSEINSVNYQYHRDNDSINNERMVSLVKCHKVLTKGKNKLKQKEIIEKKILNQTRYSYQAKLDAAEYRFKCDAEAINNEKKQNTKEFYSELYSIIANYEDIYQDFYQMIDEINMSFESKRKLYVENQLSLNEKGKVMLDNLIKNATERINNLPNELKEKNNNLKLENSDLKSKLTEANKENKRARNLEKKEIKRNKLEIEATYKINIEKIKKEQSLLEQKEKRNHLVLSRKLK